MTRTFVGTCDRCGTAHTAHMRAPVRPGPSLVLPAGVSAFCRCSDPPRYVEMRWTSTP